MFGTVSTMQIKHPMRKTLAVQNLAFRWAVCLLGVLAVIIFGIYGPGYNAASFVYMEY